MSEDARFEDAGSGPLKLVAHDAEDLAIISALIQDAVLPSSEIKWEKSRRRFAMLLNRFRWEDKVKVPERVQSVLMVEDVSHVGAQGLDPTARDLVYALLSLKWEAGEDGTGNLMLTLAGDGVINLSVDCINLSLNDVTRAYKAVTGKVPHHPE